MASKSREARIESGALQGVREDLVRISRRSPRCLLGGSDADFECFNFSYNDLRDIIIQSLQIVS